MKFYAVVEINVFDPEWVPEYTEEVTKIVEGFGGRFLARTAEVAVIEGAEAPQLSLILEFPSKSVAESFYSCEAYQPYLKLRKSGSTGKILLVAGKDDAGIAT